MAGSSSSKEDFNVFINCPFDDEYLDLFHAIIFAVTDCGFVVRCALETNDNGKVRFDKIVGVISECRFGIHDISRTQLDKSSGLPRFNMPLELGIFLGAARYGNAHQKRKTCLILERKKYDYQKYCSDLAGQDISAHAGRIDLAIAAVRNFLGNALAHIIPGPTEIHKRYVVFAAALPKLRRTLKLTKAEVGYKEYTNMVAEWLKWHPRP